MSDNQSRISYLWEEEPQEETRHTAAEWPYLLLLGEQESGENEGDEDDDAYDYARNGTFLGCR